MTRLLPESLETKRLLLREPCEADALEIFKAYAQDLEVARYMVWRPPVAVEEAERFIAQCLSDWAMGKRQAYVLAFHSEPRRPIGMLDARVHSHMLDIG